MWLLLVSLMFPIGFLDDSSRCHRFPICFNIVALGDFLVSHMCYILFLYVTSGFHICFLYGCSGFLGLADLRGAGWPVLAGRPGLAGLADPGPG